VVLHIILYDLHRFTLNGAGGSFANVQYPLVLMLKFIYNFRVLFLVD